MTKLSVNLNKIALLRNSRGRNFPNPLDFGKLALECGAHGLTVHPRPDERHARFSDLKPMQDLVLSYSHFANPPEFNVEGYPSPDFVAAVIQVKAHQCTLVPDAPDAITSNAGWDFVKNEKVLTEVVSQLKSHGIRTSLFLDPYTLTEAHLDSLRRIGSERVELYTEAYAHAFGTAKQAETTLVYSQAAEKLSALNLGINAGHDLNQSNLKAFITQVPQTLEVSIGHALIVEALLSGFKPTILSYLKILKP